MTKDEIVDLRTVSSKGQISIGSKYAGKQVQMIEQDEDTLIIRKGKFTVSYQSSESAESKK